MNKNKHWTQEYPIILEGFKQYYFRGLKEDFKKLSLKRKELVFQDGGIEIALKTSEIGIGYSQLTLYIHLMDRIEDTELKIIE